MLIYENIIDNKINIEFSNNKVKNYMLIELILLEMILQ